MHQQFSIPSMVSFVLCVFVVILASLGVEVSIASALFIVVIGFCSAHIVVFAYNAGFVQGKVSVSRGNPTQVRKPLERQEDFNLESSVNEELLDPYLDARE